MTRKIIAVCAANKVIKIAEIDECHIHLSNQEDGDTIFIIWHIRQNACIVHVTFKDPPMLTFRKEKI